MFYLAPGYFVAYLPYAVLAQALSSGIVPGVDAPVGGLVLLPAAALGQLPTLLGSPGALHAAGIGVLYEVLFNFGTRIDLDVRGHTWCVPVIRVSTLVSGMVASYILATAGLAPPGSSQLIAVVFILGAVVALSCPALRASLRGAASSPERDVLLVCGGNQSRSAMAQCIARAALASTRSGHRVRIASAGVKVHAPGAPMTDAAYAVLQEVGVIPQCHPSRRLTAELCRQADVIYCMTAEHRAAVLALAPDVADRTHRLAETELPELSTTSRDDHRRTAVVIQRDVQRRLADRFPEHFP